MKKINNFFIIILLISFALIAKAHSKILSIGSSNAKVTVKVFSSLTCPHCANFHNSIFNNLKKEYIDKGLVRFEHHAFPLDLAALNAEVVVRCQSSNDKKFRLLEEIYKKQKFWAVGSDIDKINDLIKEVGTSLDLTEDKMNECLKDPSAQDEILNQRIEAQKKYKIESTPTIMINEKKYTNDPPATFSDFWDVEKFPGRRSLPDDPAAVLEAALIADGVPKEDVYRVLSSSEGIHRALNKVKEIKDHIAFWWSSGAQPVQALASGEIDMAIGWNGRFQSGIDNGLSIEMAWGDSISHVGYIMMVNGAPNSQEAIKLLNYIIEPEKQARISHFISYGPTSDKALQYIDAKTLKKLPSTKERMNNTLFMDISWWSRNSEQVLEAYLSLIQD